MKGNASCHIPSNNYRNKYDGIFKKKKLICGNCGGEIMFVLQRQCNICTNARCNIHGERLYMVKDYTKDVVTFHTAAKMLELGLEWTENSEKN